MKAFIKCNVIVYLCQINVIYLFMQNTHSRDGEYLGEGAPPLDENPEPGAGGGEEGGPRRP